MVPDDAAEILVLSGDVPLVTAEDLQAVLGARREDDAAIALASVFAADPARLGRVIRGEFGTVESIVEAKDATEDELANNEVNAGLYAFDAEWLRRRIGSLEPSGATGELYLTELVRLAREDGRLVIAVAFEDDGRFDGINDRSQLAAAEWNLRVRRNEEHMRDGVTMRDPSTVYLDWDVTLEADVTLEPNVILRGSTSIGEGSVIGPGTHIVDSTIGRGARVWASIVESSAVEDEASDRTVQPPAPGERRRSWRRSRQLRRAQEHPPRRRLQAAPHELPRRRRGRRERQHRCGHDHRELRRERKHRTTIGDGAFIGVDTMIVAPREIGAGAKTGAGAVVTKDVPPGKLAVGVPARIREQRPKPTADADAAQRSEPSEPGAEEPPA